jgi:MinD superfamily P-loop ATPase
MSAEPNLTIAVAAGKGGTGKTLVATSLALALSGHSGRGVELLDCDVEEPNAHLLLHPRIVHRSEVTMRVPQVNKTVCTRCGVCADICEFSAIAVIRDAVLTFPDLCSGCGACAYVCPERAIVEVERLVGVVEKGVTDEGVDFYAGRTEVGQQRSGLVTRAVKRELHPDMVSILDAPPGTACPMQEAVEGADFCVLVTEPTPFGLSDLKVAVETCRELEVPCGIVLNRDGVGDHGVEGYCQAEELALLARIPHDRRIAEAYSRGDALVHAQPEWLPRFRELYANIQAQLGQREG